MTYHCRYKTNPIFPYPRKIKNRYKTYQQNSHEPSSNKKNSFNNILSGTLDNVLAPIEKLIGRKIAFDDLLLVGIIYLMFTEKENDDNTLLLCLIFILIG